MRREGGLLEDLLDADQAPESPKDSLASLVSLLAAIYKPCPDLYLDPDQRCHHTAAGAPS